MGGRDDLGNPAASHAEYRCVDFLNSKVLHSTSPRAQRDAQRNGISEQAILHEDDPASAARRHRPSYREGGPGEKGWYAPLGLNNGRSGIPERQDPRGSKG